MNTPGPEPRKLHAYPVGDFWKGKVVPLIRLQGQWLRAAGFAPGDEILVQIVGAGQLTVHKQIQADGSDDDQGTQPLAAGESAPQVRRKARP
jgi:hypothetical protein